MEFEHSEDRRMLVDTVRRFIADRLPTDARNRNAYGEVGYDPVAWAELCALGVTAALFDETAGGFGGGGFDIMAVFEEVGRGLVVEPLLGALMVGRALSVAGGQGAVLASIAAGERIAAFAHEEPGGGDGAVKTSARRVDGGWRIDGAKAVVAHGEAAALILVSARTAGGPGDLDGVSLFLIAPDSVGLTIDGYGNVDGGRSAELTLSGVSVGDDALVGEVGQGAAPIDAAIEAGLLALSAEALGVMETATAATLDYLRTRSQFGVPIGKFQALQHRMADLMIESEQMRSAVINAADAYDRADPVQRARALSAAKYTAGRVGRLVAEEAVQLHGGIGMTWELPLSHMVKRLTMIDHQLGDEDQHLARYIALGMDQT